MTAITMTATTMIDAKLWETICNGIGRTNPVLVALANDALRRLRLEVEQQRSVATCDFEKLRYLIIKGDSPAALEEFNRMAAVERLEKAQESTTEFCDHEGPCDCPKPPGIEKCRTALAALIEGLETDLPGYVYDDREAECVECGRTAKNMGSIDHEDGCLMKLVEAAREALSATQVVVEKATGQAACTCSDYQRCHSGNKCPSCTTPAPTTECACGCPQERYCIVGDNSGHEYFIPVSRSADWDAFMAIDEDDERSWDVPDFATRIDGTFTFTDPRCE